MTLRKRIFVLTAVSFSLTVAVAAYHQFFLYRDLLKKEKESFCRTSVSEFNQLVDFHKRIANSISSYISKDEEVKKLFDKGDREGLYRKLRPLYEEVRKENLIREMVLFKLPADLFLNVRVPTAKPRRTKRKDVIEAGKTCTTTKSIVVCVNYVGIRAVNPIVIGGRTLGVVSVGIDMEDFLKHYHSITGNRSGLAVKESVLKRSLREESLKKYISRSLRSGDFLIRTSDGKDDFLKELSFRDNSEELKVGDRLILACSTPVKDFSGEVIGYFFTYRDISSLSAALALESFKRLMKSYVPLMLLVFLGSLLILGRISDRVERLKRVTELIKRRKFKELEGLFPSGKDEFGEIESAIFSMAHEIEKYINVLSKEIEVYTSKAYMDSLTGVFNRRAFDEFGRELIERFLTLGKPISVLMIDVDDFKRVNDSHGHQVGDQVLAELGRLIRETLRETDIVFRYGGEEFLALLPGTSLEGALRAGDKVRRRVEAHSFPPGDQRITVSIGVAQGTEGDERAEDVVSRADRALYIAKKTGKNRVSSET